jgi:hypothetical protein
MGSNELAMAPIPERQQLRHLQGYLVGSSVWAWLRHERSGRFRQKPQNVTGSKGRRNQ